MEKTPESKVTIISLINALENKGLSIETKEQADKICHNNFGWIEYVLSPFEIIRKTENFTKALKRELKVQDIIQHTQVTFQNKKDTDYGRTFDRITFNCPGRFKYTVIFNMKSAGGTYVLYNTGDATPKKKFRNMKQLLTYMQENQN